MAKQSFLKFDKRGDTGKTSTWAVCNTSGTVLGGIRWYSPWRRYCFFTLPYQQACILDAACLAEITAHITTLMDARKAARNAKT